MTVQEMRETIKYLDDEVVITVDNKDIFELEFIEITRELLFFTK